MLAVDVGGRLYRRAGRDVVELRAAVLVRFDRHGFRADAQLHLVVRDVVGQLAANEPHRDRVIRKIGHRTRDARHLFRVRHLELRTDDR